MAIRISSISSRRLAQDILFDFPRAIGVHEGGLPFCCSRASASRCVISGGIFVVFMSASSAVVMPAGRGYLRLLPIILYTDWCDGQCEVCHGQSKLTYLLV